MTYDRDALHLWTVYMRPRDYPDNYVARRFEVWPGGRQVVTKDVIVGDTLNEVRRRLPPGLHRLERFDGDQPHIVEVWL